MCLAAIVAPLLVLASGCGCERYPKGDNLTDLCNTAGDCTLPPEDAQGPLPSTDFQMAGGESFVFPVGALLSTMSASPILSGNLVITENGRTPSGGMPPDLDPGAFRITFDDTVVACGHGPNGAYVNEPAEGLVFTCTVPAGVQKIGISYAGPTPAIACTTELDCCYGDFGFVKGADVFPAYCACDGGLCTFPIVLHYPDLMESDPTGECVSPGEAPD